MNIREKIKQAVTEGDSLFKIPSVFYNNNLWIQYLYFEMLLLDKLMFHTGCTICTQNELEVKSF